MCSSDLEATGLRVSITAKRIAAITALGRYSRAVSSKPVLEKLTVAKNRVGQWRINSLPDGLLLGQSEVDRSYRAWAVYYVDPSHTHVVADSVTLPAAAKGVPTMLVQALLSTPAPELAAGVVSGFPAGTALTYGSVPVVGGIAQVDLTADALLADRPSRRAMAAQLTWTLQQLPSISGVRLTVSGQQLTVPGTGVVSDTQDWSSYSPEIGRAHV